MNTLLWILQIVLAGVFLMAGTMKLMQPKEKMQESMGWVEDFDGTQIKAIGGLEVLGAIGLVLPGAFDIVAGITPWAALGIALLMAGAAVVHARRQEFVPYMAANIVLAVLALIVVWGRFGDYSF